MISIYWFVAAWAAAAFFGAGYVFGMFTELHREHSLVNDHLRDIEELRRKSIDLLAEAQGKYAEARAFLARVEHDYKVLPYEPKGGTRR